jgi:hypothetical protein
VTAEIKLRFVRHKGFACAAIVWRAGMVGMPFIPTHAEWVAPNGKCIGQFGHGGMQERPMGYDRDDVYVMKDGRRCDLIVSLPVTQEQADTFYAGAYAAVAANEPYDWSAPWGFLFPGHHHTPGHSVCSSKMFLLLRAIAFFRWPITVPAHLVDPRDLLMILSTHVQIDH